MKKITNEKMDFVKDLLKCGLVGYEVADKAGVSIGTVNKARKELEREGFDIWHVGGAISVYI